MSVEHAFKAASEIVSRDNEMTAKDRVPYLLTIPEVLHALSLIENMERGQFTIESTRGQRTLELSPMVAGSDSKWVDARDPAVSAPLWLKDPHNSYWFEYLADSRTVYFQYNAVGNKHGGGETLDAFFKKLFAFVEDHPVDRFIIDLRLNRGGNGVMNWPLIYGIIRSNKINQKGKLFTIVGRQTFSAGSQTAAWLGKHTNTLFVGEPTGGGVNVFGDHTSIILPNSGVEVWVSPNYYQNTYPWDKRLWINPNIMAELSSDDYRRNNDPALMAIFNYQPIAEILTKALSDGGTELMVKRYLEFKSNPKTVSQDTERDVNGLGYELMGNKRFKEAIEVFKLNVESYPRSANAYDSLAEAYMENGNKELAIKNYEKVLELDPHNQNAQQKLNKLRQ